MKIYTKKGDKGNTQLIKKNNISKSDYIFEILGTMDELNASLSLIHTSRLKKLKKLVYEIQNELFELGALVAKTNLTKEDKELFTKNTANLEDQIDEFSKDLPELKNFILPGGSKTSSQLHLSRAICRRLERQVVRYNNQNNNKMQEILPYFNRLSDLIFTLARYSNNKLGVKDQIWKKS